MNAGTGSSRSEWCLDHLVILSEAHLKHVLAEYALRYFNTARPHQGIGQQVPLPRQGAGLPVTQSIVAIPVLGGLHHDYRTAA